MTITPNADVFREAAAKMKAMRRPLLVSHRRPDGDAIGSLQALSLVLASNGAKPTALIFDALPDRYRFLTQDKSPSVLGDDLQLTDLSSFDGVVVLDTCSFGQLEPIADFLRSTRQAKIVFDHHVSRDDLGALCVIDESAAANCLILYEWFKLIGQVIDAATAEALFVGIATDTGWFRHSNTDARVFSAVADLVATGVTPNELHRALYSQEPASRIALLGRALAGCTLHDGERIALMKLSTDDFARSGATPLDTENIVEEGLRIGGVVASVLLVDRGEGTVRVSFRSRPPSEESRLDVDVAAMAAAIGGGGHRRAAGATFSGDLDDAQKAVLERLAGALAGSS